MKNHSPQRHRATEKTYFFTIISQRESESAMSGFSRKNPPTLFLFSPLSVSLEKLLAIRLNEQTTLVKSLVMCLCGGFLHS